MGVRGWELGAGLAAAVAFLTASGTQRERPLLSAGASAIVRAREADAAANPDDPTARRALAQAYLDADQPGLALVFLQVDPARPAPDVRTQHLYARALLDQGRSDGALAVESGVVAACVPIAEGARAPDGCDTPLLASALRRVDILRQMVAMGVEDARAEPEAALVAYENATREARVMFQ
jgi:hypothetical protein